MATIIIQGDSDEETVAYNGTPATPEFILMETSDFILMETGDKIKLQ